MAPRTIPQRELRNNIGAILREAEAGLPVKELCRRWSPELMQGFTKESTHTAISDIRDSVAELRYYREFMGRLGGNA